MSDFSAWLEKNKALWARVYDEVIAPDLEQEWKRRNEEHEKELKQKNEHQQILYAHVNNEVIKNARLVEENARLKKLLQKQSNEPATSAEQLEASTTDATILASDYHHIADKYNDLNKRYQDATQKMKYLERKNAAVMQKNKEMKESVRAWQEYCDRHMGKNRSKTEGKAKDEHSKQLAAIEAYDARLNLPSTPSSSAVVTPGSLAGQERSSPVQYLPLAHIRAEPVEPVDGRVLENVVVTGQQEPNQAAEHAGSRSPSHRQVDAPTGTESGTGHGNSTFLGQRSSDNLGSSQTTEDEAAEHNDAEIRRTAHADDDEMPEVVSARSLKRKRKPSRSLNVHQDRVPSDGTPARPIRVKEEQFSSPPPETAMYQLQRKETMDLDELGAHVIRTPRKRLRTHSIHSNSTGTLRNQRSNSAPFSGHQIKNEPADDDVQIADPQILTLRRADTTLSEPGDSIAIPRDVLQPLDPNVVANANEDTPNKRIQKKEARRAAAYEILGESGETPPLMDENDTRLPPSIARAQHNRRLKINKDDRILAKSAHRTPKAAPRRSNAGQVPTPPPSTDRPSNAPSALRVYGKAQAAESRPSPRAAPSDTRPIWTMGPSSEPPRKAPAPPPKKNVPLRPKPISELQLKDFKPNPKYNQGYTYAFSETVRKRGDRMCLPGCTNPSCCGSTFRSLAAAAAPLSRSQEEELLQDYLGDAYDSFGLTQMSQKEREELVLQARTRKMSKDHGKHRQAYEGRKTPPGFWRVGFPNTQEQEEDREMAAKMEREMVRDRWLEAMRRNGKWIFRDE